MGQKVHPYSFRLGVSTDWKSKWFSDKEYVDFVNEDWRIRDYLKRELVRGAVSWSISSAPATVSSWTSTPRPGVVIGRKGAEAERLRGDLEALAKRPVKLNINEVKDPDLDAALLARGVADQIENRIAFRRPMKRAIAPALKAGAEGVRVECKGRLGGADMGRREWYREGRVPSTLRADIDYGTATAKTTVGAIGVKVWVYRGEVVSTGQVSGDRIAAEADLATGGRRRTQKSIKSAPKRLPEPVSANPVSSKPVAGSVSSRPAATRRAAGVSSRLRRPQANWRPRPRSHESAVEDVDVAAPAGAAPAEPTGDAAAADATVPVVETPAESTVDTDAVEATTPVSSEEEE